MQVDPCKCCPTGRHGLNHSIAPRDTVSITCMLPNIPASRNYALSLASISMSSSHLNWDVLFSDAEELEARVGALLGLGVAVHAHRQVVTGALPHHAALADAEQVLLTQLLAGGQGDEGHLPPGGERRGGEGDRGGDDRRKMSR